MKLPGKRIDTFDHFGREIELRMDKYMGAIDLYAYCDGELLARGTDVQRVSHEARTKITQFVEASGWIKIIIITPKTVFGANTNIGDVDYTVLEVRPSTDDGPAFFKDKEGVVHRYMYSLPQTYPSYMKGDLYTLFDESVIVYLDDLKMRFAELSKRVSLLIGSPDKFLEVSTTNVLTKNGDNDVV